MMRAMLWKEYREHRLIWLTMMVVNSGALLGMSRLDETGGFGQGGSKLVVLGPVAMLLVWAYGMVCGGMLLAGEREEATLSFLDTLPVTRFGLWLAKGQIGMLLVVGQTLVLCGWLAGLRAAEEPLSLWIYALGMLLCGGIGLAYGLFFSARGENVLHTIGLAILGQIIAWITAFFLAFAVEILLLIFLHWLVEGLTGNRHNLRIPSQSGLHTIVTVMLYGGLTLAAIVGSARRFGRPDLLRRPVAAMRLGMGASIRASLLRLVWLCYRQIRGLALGVLASSLGLGLLFLLTGPLIWPVVTLFLGVLCGVTVFADEQVSGSFRFLGEQRLPLVRVWLIKTGMHFALLLLASFLILLPVLLVAYSGAVQRSEPQILREMPYLSLMVLLVPPMSGGLLAPLASFLLMWLLYGFSLGQLCGLLSRKSVVAAMIALMASAGLAIVWLPSLAGIGLHFWQIAGPPLILLFTAALLIWPWAANRLASWRIYLGVSVAMAAALLWMAFGVWYRAIEVPDVPEPFDVAAYKASLPPLEENEAGQLIRGAWGGIESVLVDMSNQHTKKKTLIQQCSEIVNDGWPAGKSQLGEWMDKAFADDWLQPLAPLPDLPLGMVPDARLLTQSSRELNKWHSASNLSKVLAARGLQQQAHGDPAVFVEHMQIALALSRNLQHHAPSRIAVIDGRATTNIWPAAVDAWLKKLRERPNLLRRALQALIDHEAKLPDEREAEKADYLIARNTLMEAPEQLLDDVIPDHPNREAELHTITMLWLVPWEQERHQRLLRVEFGGNPQELRKSFEWGGRPFKALGFSRRRFRQGRSRRELAHLRACQLKLALRLYQAENGELPAGLDALVPRYLQSIPLDPFSGQPLRYRCSRGEWIDWPQPNQPGHMAPPGGMPAVPGEVPVMPLADEPAAPAAPALPAAPMAGAGMPAGGMAGMVDEGPPGGEVVPFMPGADEAAVPPPRFRGEGRFVPKGQGILWSVGEDGQDDGGKKQGIPNPRTTFGADLIYFVPPPPP